MQRVKSHQVFLCNNCGNEFPKWSGQCPACKEWNSLTEVSSLLKPLSKNQKPTTKIKPENISQSLSQNQAQTFPSQINELDRVLGGGLTCGGVYLLAGQPGIGKSTLLTQLALSIANKKPITGVLKTNRAQRDRAATTVDVGDRARFDQNSQDDKVLYVCSEENTSQVASRIKRLTDQDNQSILLLNTSELEAILENIQSQNPKPRLIIIDSIQSIYTNSNNTTSGSPSQIRDCSAMLIRTAKEFNLPMIIVGHVTKDGDIAGPKLLEHMVDVVLDLEGDRQHELRLLHGIKNRFGPTDETGIFRMTGAGLEEVPDPSKFLLQGRLENAPGSALALIMEGTRPMTIEVQALVVDSFIPVPRRVAKGISTNRLQLICAVLTKHLKLSLGSSDVFVNITGGINVSEPGVDLAVALAIISSYQDKPLPPQTIVFGEIGLLGEIRAVTFQDKRLKDAKTLGYKNILSSASQSTLKSLGISRQTPAKPSD